MHRAIRALVVVGGTCLGCATAPPIACPGPGHPASVTEPEAPRATSSQTLRPESVPAMLDNAPRGGGVESRPAAPESQPEGGHHHHGHGQGGGS